MNPQLRLCALASVLAASALPAQVVTIDFATNPNTVSLNGIDGTELVHSGTIGLSGGGGLRGRIGTAPVGNMSAARTVKTISTFDPTIGAISASVYFWFDPAVIGSNNSTLSANDRFAAIGFTTTTTNGTANPNGPAYGGSSIYASLGGGRAGTDPAFTYSLQTRPGVRAASNTLAGTDNAAQWAPTAAGWYFWNVSFTNTGGTNWTIQSTISLSSADGVVGGQVVSRSSNFTSGPLLSDLANMVGVLQVGENDRMGVHAYDNLSFAVVPEPSSFGLLASALAGGLLVLRRRRVA